MLEKVQAIPKLAVFSRDIRSNMNFLWSWRNLVHSAVVFHVMAEPGLSLKFGQMVTNLVRFEYTHIHRALTRIC